MKQFTAVEAKKPLLERDLENRLYIVFIAMLLVMILDISRMIFFTARRPVGYSMGKEISQDDYQLYMTVFDNYVPRRGDIVSFFPPSITCGEKNAHSRSFVEFTKRVIGLPGETVTIKGHHVFIDGNEILEPYAIWTPFKIDAEERVDIKCDYPEGMRQTAEDNCVFGCDPETTVSWTVPAGYVFVLGDSRYASVDSRSFSFVPLDGVHSKVVMIVWPLDRVRFIGSQPY